MSAFRVLRQLFARGDPELVDLLVAHIDAVIAAARKVEMAILGELSGARLEQEVRQIEHTGDDRRRDLISHMSRSVALPLDREDVYRLSRSIDDILDCLRDFSEEWSLYEASANPVFTPLIAEIQQALDQLRATGELMTSEPSEVAWASLRIKKRATRVRRAYQRALRDLFDETTLATGSVLKQRELLRRLDVVALRLQETANVLADAAVKRSF